MTTGAHLQNLALLVFVATLTVGGWFYFGTWDGAWSSFAIVLWLCPSNKGG